MTYTSKEQERAALQQIRKIVDGLGTDSYIGAAFTGAFELADQNIEYDMGCTMLETAEIAMKEADKKYAAAVEKMQEAKKAQLAAEELQKKFLINRDYWEDIRKNLDWAAYQLSDKLGY